MFSWIMNKITTRQTSGKTPGGRFVSEGQTWNLSENLSEDLPSGAYVIEQYYGNRVLLVRKDARRVTPVGALPVYEIETLDNENFELIKDGR